MKKGWIYIAAVAAGISFALTGCGGGTKNHGLDAKKPERIMVWNYYNGAQAIVFSEYVDEFNNTVGADMGIIVETESKSTVDELYQAVEDSVNRLAGADELPDIFPVYLDGAASLDEQGILTDLSQYVSDEERAEYIDSYIKEGYFGTDGGWKLFPVAKSTEIMILNKTDWDIFAEDTGASLDSLSTIEGLTKTAEKYYQWSGGKSFFGRDAFANYIFAGSASLGKEIYTVEDGKATPVFDETIIRKLWDNYYVPYVKGYFKHVGRYRSDDIKLGEIVAQICSTSSASYFPKEVTRDGETYAIDYLVLPVPKFEDAERYIVQQGASMAVVKSTEQREYASVVFLKWLTDPERNMKFALESGYLPVKKEANSMERLEEYRRQNGGPSGGVESDVIASAFEAMQDSVPYTMTGFAGADKVRSMLGYSMIDLAAADREAVLAAGSAGDGKQEELLSQFLSDEYFKQWYEETRQKLEKICSQ